MKAGAAKPIRIRDALGGTIVTVPIKGGAAGGSRLPAVVRPNTTTRLRYAAPDGHPFFVATLFQHELRSEREGVHPLVVEFVEASAAAGRT